MAALAKSALVSFLSLGFFVSRSLARPIASPMEARVVRAVNPAEAQFRSIVSNQLNHFLSLPPKRGLEYLKALAGAPSMDFASMGERQSARTVLALLLNRAFPAMPGAFIVHQGLSQKLGPENLSAIAAAAREIQRFSQKDASLERTVLILRRQLGISAGAPWQSVARLDANLKRFFDASIAAVVPAPTPVVAPLETKAVPLSGLGKYSGPGQEPAALEPPRPPAEHGVEPGKSRIHGMIEAGRGMLRTALEARRLAKKHEFRKVPEGVRATFRDPSGIVYVTVRSRADAHFLAEAYERSGEDSILDFKVPVPERRHVRFDRRRPISFGIEAEFNLRENPAVLWDYRPPSIPEKKWRKMAFRERLAAAEQAFPKTQKKGVVALRKLSTAPRKLPALLRFEGDGNFEMNGLVFDSMGKLRDSVRFLIRRYGPISLQGHDAYKDYDEVQGTAGYVVFESDLAQLKSLERNYGQFLKRPEVLPGKNLVHHSLGPLGEADRELFLELERRAGRGQKVGRPGSARLSYAPVFRDDIYPEGYKGHEFRQFHKRDEELLSAMDEFSRILAVSGDLTPFEPFAEIKLLSPDLPAQRARELDIFIDAAAWRDFFQRIGEAAEEKIKRSVLNPSIRIGAAPLAERFFYPLRDWSRHPVIQNLPPTEKPQALLRIERASRGFIRRVNSLVERERDGGASSEGLIEPLQTAVARWGYEANLSEYFQTFKNNILTAGGARGPPLAAAPFVRSISQVMAHPHEMREFSNGKEYVYYKDGGELDLKSKAYQDFLDSSVEVYYSPGYEHVFLRIGRKSYSFPNYIPKEFNPRIKKEKGFMFQVGKERIQEVLSGIDGLHEAMRPFFDIDSRELEISRLPDDRLSLDGRIVNTSAEIVDENGEVFLKDKNGFAWPLVKKGEKLFIQSLSCATSATYIMRKYFGIDIGFKYGAKSLKEALSRGNPQGRSPDAIIDYQKPVLFYETTAFITVVSFLIAAVILGGFMLLTWFAPPLPPGGGGGGGGSGVGGLL